MLVDEMFPQMRGKLDKAAKITLHPLTIYQGLRIHV